MSQRVTPNLWFTKLLASVAILIHQIAGIHIQQFQVNNCSYEQNLII